MPINTPDNISTSTNSGPQQGSGTGGITHITGEGAFNFSGGDNTMPNSSSTSFKDLIDIGFRKTLESIGFMRVVVERIEQKQNITIDYIKEALAGNKVIHEKIDDLRKTLSKMEDDKRKSTMSEDLKRREDELEKLTKPSLVSGREGFDGSSDSDGKSSSSFWYLALPIAAGIMGQVFHLAPQIRGFLEFIKGTEKLIGGLAGASASGIGAGTAAAAKFSSIFNAGKAGLMSTVTNFASGLARASMQNVLKWLNKLKFAARSVIVLDALFTIVFAQATADDPQGVENSFARALGKIVGGTGGAWILGSLMGIAMSWIPFAGPVAAIAGAILGGYYGTIVGEDVGRAMYKWFASDLKDFSGFYAIWRRIENDLTSAVDYIIPSSGSSSSKDGSKPSGGSGAGWDRDAQKKRDEELKRNMDAATGKPSVGGTPTPSTGGVAGGGGGGGGNGKSGGSSWKPDNAEVEAAERYYADNTGGDLALARTMAEIESGHNPEAGYWKKDKDGNRVAAPEGTGYKGLFQTRRTRHSPMDGAKDAVASTNRNREYFKRHMGRYPTPAEIYLLHQQGIAGGTAYMQAYYNDPNMRAVEGMAKWMVKGGHNKNWTVEMSITNLKGNMWGALAGKNHLTITVKEFVDLFVADFNRRYEKYKKQETGGDAQKPKTGAPVSAGMTPVSYSPSDYSGGGRGGGGSSKSRYEGTDVDTSGYSNVPSYGDGGKNTYAEGTRYDKTLDKNHPALDILVSQMYKKGHIPSGSVVSFNDKHHAKKGETNVHRQGLGVDISQAGGSQQTRNALIGAIKSCGLEYNVNIAAEDHTFAAGTGSTGQHVHAYFRSRQDADTFLTNWLKKNGVKGKSPKLSGSSPEIIAGNPSSGASLMAYGMGSQQPKVVQVTQPVIVQGGGSSGGGRKGGGTSGAIPSSFRPSNRDILNAYT
jgi:hypothetical protein